MVNPSRAKITEAASLGIGGRRNVATYLLSGAIADTGRTREMTQMTPRDILAGLFAVVHNTAVP